jgi:hypothetical protein
LGTSIGGKLPGGKLLADNAAAVAGERVEATVALVERRGYALPAWRLGEVCLGGRAAESEVLAAVASSPSLRLMHGLVVGPELAPVAPAIALRARTHQEQAAAYMAATLRFVRALVRVSPYVLGVAVAGSLASGGFVESDDVDLNLLVEDGHRHLAYVTLSTLGVLHALRHRGKPTDALTRRPLAPRLMTANLILERSQYLPLTRQDAAMAYELLCSRPVFGRRHWRELVVANPPLAEHLPQLREWAGDDETSERGGGLPRWLFPSWADAPARVVGGAAWHWMQWTRRRDGEALARVAFVRETMRPYALFQDQ